MDWGAFTVATVFLLLSAVFVLPDLFLRVNRRSVGNLLPVTWDRDDVPLICLFGSGVTAEVARTYCSVRAEVLARVGADLLWQGVTWDGNEDAMGAVRLEVSETAFPARTLLTVEGRRIRGATVEVSKRLRGARLREVLLTEFRVALGLRRGSFDFSLRDVAALRRTYVD